MTVLSAPSAAPAATALPVRRLRALLTVDGLGTTALGAVAVLAAEPLAALVATPGALRVVGALFVLIGLDMLLTSRTSGRRLALGARALGVADLAFAAGALGAAVATGTSGPGLGLVLVVAAVCIGMGTAKLRLASDASDPSCALVPVAAPRLRPAPPRSKSATGRLQAGSATVPPAPDPRGSGPAPDLEEP